MKRCPHCKETKPHSAFYRNKSRPDGLGLWCKKCADADNRARYRKRGGYVPNPAVYWKRATKQWQYAVERKYGLKPAEYERLLAWSNGGCAICGQRAEKQRLDVDHNHQTGNVRGLLCRACNSGLGHFREDVRLLRIAVAYLEFFEGVDGHTGYTKPTDLPTGD